MTGVRPTGSDGTVYEVQARRRMGTFGRRDETYRSRNVIFAGGVLGTVDLLLSLQSDPDALPALPTGIGDRVRTNSEVLMGVTTRRRDLDLSEGVAITSIFHTDERSSLEPVRFSRGSGFFRLLATPHAPGATLPTRVWNAFGRMLKEPIRFLRAWFVRDWAKSTAILMYMRAVNGFIRLEPRKAGGGPG